MLANLFTRLARWIAPGPELKARASRHLYEHECLQEELTAGDPFVMTQARLMQIEERQAQLATEIADAERRKAKRSHLTAERTRLTTERLQLERLWSMG